MTDILDRARGALHAQPFSMLLGAELMSTGTHELALCLPIRDELRQQHGFVHGGVISYLEVLDTERQRLSAEQQLTQAQRDVLTSLVQLYKALGGGWQ